MSEIDGRYVDEALNYKKKVKKLSLIHIFTMRPTSRSGWRSSLDTLFLQIRKNRKNIRRC